MADKEIHPLDEAVAAAFRRARERAARARGLKKITQEDFGDLLAEHLGKHYSRSSVSRWERAGRSDAPAVALMAAFRLAGIRVDDFLDRPSRDIFGGDPGGDQE